MIRTNCLRSFEAYSDDIVINKLDTNFFLFPGANRTCDGDETIQAPTGSLCQNTLFVC